MSAWRLPASGAAEAGGAGGEEAGRCSPSGSLLRMPLADPHLAAPHLACPAPASIRPSIQQAAHATHSTDLCSHTAETKHTLG